MPPGDAEGAPHATQDRMPVEDHGLFDRPSKRRLCQPGVGKLVARRQESGSEPEAVPGCPAVRPNRPVFLNCPHGVSPRRHERVACPGGHVFPGPDQEGGTGKIAFVGPPTRDRPHALEPPIVHRDVVVEHGDDFGTAAFRKTPVERGALPWPRFVDQADRQPPQSAAARLSIVLRRLRGRSFVQISTASEKSPFAWSGEITAGAGSEELIHSHLASRRRTSVRGRCTTSRRRTVQVFVPGPHKAVHGPSA